MYHVLNRANGLDLLFETPESYRDYLRLVSECADTDRMRILAFCLMPNHWHMLLWPRDDDDLYRFVHRLSVRHAKRLHARNGTEGRGHIYQARYKSFPVQTDCHLAIVHRYIEMNPVRARLVARARDWPWSSATTRNRSNGGNAPLVAIEPSPVSLPDDWDLHARAEDDDGEIRNLRESFASNIPFGDRGWTIATAARIGLPLEPAPRGRPRKA